MSTIPNDAKAFYVVEFFYQDGWVVDEICEDKEHAYAVISQIKKNTRWRSFRILTYRRDGEEYLGAPPPAAS